MSNSSPRDLVDKLKCFQELWNKVYAFVLFKRNQILKEFNPDLKLCLEKDSLPELVLDNAAVELDDLCRELRSHFGVDVLKEVHGYLFSGQISTSKPIGRYLKLQDGRFLERRDFIENDKRLSSDLYYKLNELKRWLKEALKQPPGLNSEDFLDRCMERKERYKDDYIEPARSWSEEVNAFFDSLRKQLEEEAEKSESQGITIYDVAFASNQDSEIAVATVKRFVDSRKYTATPIGKCPIDGRKNLYEIDALLSDYKEFTGINASETTRIFKEISPKLRFPTK